MGPARSLFFKEQGAPKAVSSGFIRRRLDSGTMTTLIRVVLVDDHEMVAKSLGSILEQEPDITVVGSARTSHDGVLLAGATGPDVAIVDYQLPDENGTHTTREIIAVSPQTRVLMLTGATLGTQLVSAAVRAGCIGILTKDKAIHQLVKAVRAAHVGDAYLSSQAVARMVTRARLERGGLGESLTDRETRGSPADSSGPLQSGDRRATLRECQYGEESHAEDPPQTHRSLQARSRRRRLPRRVDRAARLDGLQGRARRRWHTMSTPARLVDVAIWPSGRHVRHEGPASDRICPSGNLTGAGGPAVRTDGEAAMSRSGRLGSFMAGVTVLAGTMIMAGGSAVAAQGSRVSSGASWNKAIAGVPLPGSGCFTAHYPALAWHATRCRVAPAVPFEPAAGNLSAPPTAAKAVGNGNDYSAVVTGPITEATGSFADVSPGISEKGQFDGRGRKLANTFSLQLNTQFFTGSPACSGSSKPSKCQAWQQFVYDNHSDTLFMQYWLIGYSATCPAHWFTYHSDCYTNSPANTLPGGLTAAELATTTLSGTATLDGTDVVDVANGSQVSSVSNPDSVLDLAQSWNTTEWGLFGDAGGGQAKFGKETTLEAQTTISSSSLSAPQCVEEGFTGETNNLTLSGTPALGTVATPTMGSRQTNEVPTPASCATAPG